MIRIHNSIQMHSFGFVHLRIPFASCLSVLNMAVLICDLESVVGKLRIQQTTSSVESWREKVFSLRKCRDAAYIVES
jgi:hypothetical protein